MKDFKLSDYRADVERLITYVSWFESKRGNKVSKLYDDNDLSRTTISFPVYDTMLLNFVNDAEKTGLIDRNYAYGYSKYGIRSVADEHRVISEATVPDAGALSAILSKYVLGGMTKGVVWQTAVEEGIFYEILVKLKELLAIWDAPLA